MTRTASTEGAPRAPEDLDLLGRRIDDLSRHIAELTRIVSAVVVAPTSAVEKPVSCQIDELERRLGDEERRTASIASLVQGHEKMIRMMCILLRDLDDPYGMGSSLDDRIGLEGGPSDWDGCGETS